MRFSSAVAGLVLLSAPALTTAQSAWSSWETTTTEYQATTTVTMTLLAVNATVTSSIPKHTGFNATTTASFNAATVNPSAVPSVCDNCMQSSDASSDQINLAVAAGAGLLALAWGSL